MKDDDDTLTLRDRLALEILHGLLTGDNNVVKQMSYHAGGPISAYIEHGSAGKLILLDDQGADQHMEKLARLAYRMADIMRRVRLTAFE